MPDIPRISESLLKISMALGPYKNLNLTDDMRITVFNTPYRESGYIQRPGVKPNGLWYGFGYSWLDWCESEQPDWLEEYNHIYEVHVGGNVLQIKTYEELKEFTKKYKHRIRVYIQIIILQN